MWGVLNFFREALTLFQLVRSEEQAGSRVQAGARNASGSEAKVSLRPPTIALDMLFLLAFLAFLEMNPVSESVITYSPDLPTADKNAGLKPITPLVLRPIQSNQGWLYITTEGQQLTAAEVAAHVRAKTMTPVMVIEKSSSIQTYLDSQQQLSAQGLKNIGLAALSTQGEKQ